MSRIPAAFSLLLLAVSATLGDEAEWPRFRGPNGSGISHATTVPARWTETDYNWKIELPGAGHSSPVVWGTRVFVTCGEPQTAQRRIVCLDAADGHVLWRRDDPSTPYRQHGDNDYASATPAVDADGLVVTWTTPESLILLALDLDGREVWRRDFGRFVATQGSGSSPILAGGLVILANDQEDPKLVPGHKDDSGPVGTSSVIAVDRRTGRTRWEIERHTSFSAYSTPCLFQPSDGPAELILSSTEHGLTGADPATGKVHWEFGRPFLDRAVSSPVVAPGLVIAGHGSGVRASRYIAVRPGNPRENREPSLAYEIKRAIPLVPTPLVKDGRLYLWTDDGVVSCLRVESGETVWQERVGGSYYGSPVWVDGRLYCISRKGEVVVLAAADKFEVLARVPLGEPSFATPAVAGGVMYPRTRTHLFSLGGAKPSRQASVKPSRQASARPLAANY